MCAGGESRVLKLRLGNYTCRFAVRLACSGVLAALSAANGFSADVRPLEAVAQGPAASFTGTIVQDTDAREFLFTLNSPGTVVVKTLGYAGGVNAAGTTIPEGGFDPSLAVFDSSGNLIATNQDGGCGTVPADSVTSFCWDSYLSMNLPAGTYRAVLTQSTNTANGPTLADSFNAFCSAANQTAGNCTQTFTPDPNPGVLPPGFWDESPDRRNGSYAVDILGAATTAAPSINSGQPPFGVTGSQYPTFTFTVQPPSSAYTWSVTTGSLPPGLSLNATTGALSGTPSAAGSFPFTVQATDGVQPLTQSVTITVYSPVLVTTSSLPPGTLGVAYGPVQVTATGGSGSFSYAATGLPGGLSINASTGVIAGTPTAAGTFSSVVITATDTTTLLSANSSPLTIVISYPPIVVTTASLPPGTVGVAYGPVSVTVTGGSGNFTYSATGLPGGLSINPSTGSIGGVPSAPGTSSGIVITAKDNVTGLSGSSGPLSIAVSYPTLSITSSGSLGEIASGTNVSAALTANGGAPPYTWTASGIPTGLSLSSGGALSGTPYQPGNYTFGIQVSDSEKPAMTASGSLSIQVLGITTPGTLPAGTVSTAYSQTFAAAGGTGPYTFSAQNLPPGLSFNGATLSGTPTTDGSFGFTVQVTDASSFTASSLFGLVVTGAATAPLTVSGGALPGQVAGTPYAQILNATGGSPAYTWTIIGGSLPEGFSINSATGEITGTSSIPGTATFTAQATDGQGHFASAAFTVTIAPAPLKAFGAPFPNGIAGSDYQLQILTETGGIAPYTWTISSGSLPPGLTLASGQISGIPTTAGTFPFSLTATDAETPAMTVTLNAQIFIAPASVNLILSQGVLNFSLTTGSFSVPTPANVTVRSSVVQDLLNYTVVPTPAVSWLDVTGGGITPGSITVSLDPSALNLAASTTPLTTSIVVTCVAPSPCAGLAPQTILVSLQVSTPPPVLTFGANMVSFSAPSSSAAPQSQPVTIQNTGGGVAAISSASAADAWLTVSGVPASLAGGPPVNITLTANPAGLTGSFYRTLVTIVSTGGTITLPVTLSLGSSLTLSSNGATFQSVIGGVPGNPTGSFYVGSIGGALSWTASVLPGASWLVLSSVSGSGTTPGTVSYSIDPVAAAALTPAQAYYGTIQVSAPGAIDSPLNFQVVLNVAASTTLPRPDPEPSGLIFQSNSGAPAPPSQTVNVYTASPIAVAYAASQATTYGSPWLTVSPSVGTAAAGAPGVSTVSVNPGSLPAGIYYGSVSYQFSAAAVRTVNVTMIISAVGGAGTASVHTSTSSASTSTTGACTSSQLVPTQTGLVNNFAQPAAWPTPLSVTVLDNCGSPVGSGQVIATFSNGDPPLALKLASSSTGLYSGTWTPRATSPEVSVTATVTAPGFAASAITRITGEVAANAAPLLAQGGTLHIYDPLVGGAIGQGTILQIYGSNMAAGPAVPTTTPIPTSLNGTSVIIGGYPAPLYYVSAGQIDAELPYELTPGNSYQIIVNANGALSAPQTVQISAATPGIAAFASGQIVAQHSADFSLVTEASPAKPGEYLVIYLAGLGAVNNPVPDGVVSPSNPLSSPLIAPVLTLNGNSIPVYFSGLTPGDVGLYQMNFQVPAATPSGDLPLVVSQSGSPSNATILPVHN